MYHFFCGFKNAQKQPCLCDLQKRCSSKCCKVYRKTLVSESVYNKVKLATLLKKDSDTGVFLWIFWNYYGQIFFKTPLATASECWRLEKSSWLLVKDISFFNPLRFIILNDSILMDPFMGYKNFIFKLFTKDRRNWSSFSEVFALLTICFLYLIIVRKVANLLLAFVFCMIFVHVRFMSFWPWMK